MAWHIARTIGRETVAQAYLSRVGIRSFRPVEHRYFIDRKTKLERFRIVARFPGYVFVELENAAERDAASRAMGVAGFLGWWTGDGYRLAEIPSHYVTDLIDAGPEIINKQLTRGRFKQGQKVKLAVSAISDIVGEFKHDVDNGRKCVISVNALGSVYDVTVELERLAAAEEGYGPDERISPPAR